MFKALNQKRSQTPELISYQTTRNAIGWLGVLLPIVLFVCSMLSSIHQIQPSISHYYYTNLRELFVGVLCAVSLFLFTYKGQSKLDGIATNAAGFFSLGVAMFPTDIIPNHPGQNPVVAPIEVSFSSVIHFSCAALFFLTLAFISFCLFTQSSHTKETMPRQKRMRNKIFRLSGVVIFLCVVVLGIAKLVIGIPDTNPLTFWLETVALLFFGLSWLTKGESLYGDKKE